MRIIYIIPIMVCFFSTAKASSRLPYRQGYVPNEVKKRIPEFGYSGEQGMGPSHLEGRSFSLKQHLGPLDLKDAVIETSLEVVGPLTAKLTTFKGNLTVQSPLILHGKSNAVKGYLLLVGPLWGEGMTYEKSVSILGYLEAYHSVFKGAIKIYTSKVILENCEIQDLYVDDREEHPADIILKNTKVNGEIKVQSGQGRVMSFGNTRFDPRKVKGVTSF